MRLTIDDLRAVPANAAVLSRVEGRSAHSDVAEVLVRRLRLVHGRRVVAVGGSYPALVAAGEDGEVVAYALGMRELGLHVDRPPDGARLEPREMPDLGPGWWVVNPFCADVTVADTDAELRAWFARLR